MNACEVKAHLIGLLAKPWRRLFLAAYTRLGFKTCFSKTKTKTKTKTCLSKTKTKTKTPRFKTKTKTKTLMSKTKTQTQDLHDQYWKSMTGIDCDKQKD